MQSKTDDCMLRNARDPTINKRRSEAVKRAWARKKAAAANAPEQGHHNFVDEAYSKHSKLSAKNTEGVDLEAMPSPGSQYCEQDDGYERDEYVLYCRAREIGP